MPLKKCEEFFVLTSRLFWSYIEGDPHTKCGETKQMRCAMKMELRKFKGGRYLVLLPALAIVLSLTTAAIARVVNNHSASGTLENVFTVASTDDYNLQVKAPSSGNITGVVLKVDGEYLQEIVQITRHNGACGVTNVNLEVSNSYCLRSIANITSGTASACVYSDVEVNCCPPGSGS